jgi:hypothetical protein
MADSQLAPPDRQVTIEGKQARRLPRLGELLEAALDVRSRPVTVARAWQPPRDQWTVLYHTGPIPRGSADHGLEPTR